jgi:hypothetical protein
MSKSRHNHVDLLFSISKELLFITNLFPQNKRSTENFTFNFGTFTATHVEKYQISVRSSSFCIIIMAIWRQYWKYFRKMISSKVSRHVRNVGISKIVQTVVFRSINTHSLTLYPERLLQWSRHFATLSPLAVPARNTFPRQLQTNFERFPNNCCISRDCRLTGYFIINVWKCYLRFELPCIMCILFISLFIHCTNSIRVYNHVDRMFTKGENDTITQSD